MVSVSPNESPAGSNRLREMRDELGRLYAYNAQLVDENARLLTENTKLRSQIRDARAALDVHVPGTARPTRVYGPLEMTAGTCVGPRRSRQR